MRQTAAERGEWQSGFHRFTAEGAIAVPFTLRDLASAAQPGRSFESATYLRGGRGLRRKVRGFHSEFELDVNRLLVTHEGGGAVAIDARLALAR